MLLLSYFNQIWKKNELNIFRAISSDSYVKYYRWEQWFNNMCNVRIVLVQSIESLVFSARVCMQCLPFFFIFYICFAVISIYLFGHGFDVCIYRTNRSDDAMWILYICWITIEIRVFDFLWQTFFLSCIRFSPIYILKVCKACLE